MIVSSTIQLENPFFNIIFSTKKIVLRAAQSRHPTWSDGFVANGEYNVSA
jgi:hypothetical protein